MSYKIKSEEEEFKDEINLEKKYSKKIFLGSLIGLGFIAIKYYFSNEMGFETMNKTFEQMNNKEVINTTVFGLTSLGTFGGGIMYGITSFMEKDFKIKFNKENNLEKQLKS